MPATYGPTSPEPSAGTSQCIVHFDPRLVLGRSGGCRRAVLRSGHGGEDDEPTSVVTELVIDSSGGQRRVKRKKQADSGGSSATDRGNGMQLRGSDSLQLQRDSQGAGSVQRQKTAAELYAEKQAAALVRALPRDFDWQASLDPPWQAWPASRAGVKLLYRTRTKATAGGGHGTTDASCSAGDVLAYNPPAVAVCSWHLLRSPADVPAVSSRPSGQRHRRGTAGHRALHQARYCAPRDK